jgi:Phage integrase family
MRQAGGGLEGARLRALIVILWRAGLRIGEALDLAETDLDVARGAVLVRRGKGGRRREVGMDRWAWSQLDAWLAVREELPVGALLCVVRGTTAGRQWDVSSARKQLARTAAKAGVRRRFAPHQLRHAHLGVTSIYLRGIDSSEIIDTVHSPARTGHLGPGRAHSEALSPARQVAADPARLAVRARRAPYRSRLTSVLKRSRSRCPQVCVCATPRACCSRTDAPAPQSAMTIFPRACPSPW